MKQLKVTVDGKTYDVTVEIVGEDSASVKTSSPSPVVGSVGVSAPTSAAKTLATAGAGDVTSPLAGKVISVDVKVGQAVKSGDQLLTLEAMKMNTMVFAPADGTVATISCNPGDAVEEGQILVKIS